MVGNLCTKSVYRQPDVSMTRLLFLCSDVMEATVLEPQSFSAVGTLSFVNRFTEPHRNFKAHTGTRKLKHERYFRNELVPEFTPLFTNKFIRVMGKFSKRNLNWSVEIIIPQKVMSTHHKSLQLYMAPHGDSG